jgi:hypothetical protein
LRINSIRAGCGRVVPNFTITLIVLKVNENGRFEVRRVRYSYDVPQR